MIDSKLPLKRKNHKIPYKIIYWKDSCYTNAIGWIVIQNKINGVAGGGLFMTPSASLKEVEDLAYTMSLKNTLQEIRMGGAKGGIRFDPNDPQAEYVLSRFLVDNKDVIKNEWCTGGDLNTTTLVITKLLKEATSLSSPFICLSNMLQERFYIHANLNKFLKCLQYPSSPYFNVEDLITGYSVIESILMIIDGHIAQDKRLKIIIQGFGKVGKAVCFFAKQYFDIVGICEKEWFIYDKDGINVDELITEKNVENIIHLFKPIYRKINETPENFLVHFLRKSEADIFCPCAQRYAVTDQVLDCLIKQTFLNKNLNKNFIISGANNVFINNFCIDKALDAEIVIVPEWISNSGSALLFMEAMKFKDEIDEKWLSFIFSKVKYQIRKFIEDLPHPIAESNSNFYSSCYQLAEDYAVTEYIGNGFAL